MTRQDIEFVLDTKEWEGFIEMARGLPARVGQNAFSKSVNQGVDQILNQMRSNIGSRAYEPTGMLMNSLGRRRKRIYEPLFWHGAVSVRTGKKRGDGAFYWNIVEHGHRVVTPGGRDTGKKVRAMEYAINAVETTKASVLGDFTSRARAELERGWK